MSTVIGVFDNPRDAQREGTLTRATQFLPDVEQLSGRTSGSPLRRYEPYRQMRLTL
jgi:hypothetical protein